MFLGPRGRGGGGGGGKGLSDRATKEITIFLRLPYRTHDIHSKQIIKKMAA